MIKAITAGVAARNCPESTIAFVAALRSAGCGCRMVPIDAEPTAVVAQQRARLVVPVPAVEPSGAMQVVGLVPVFAQSVLMPAAVTFAANWHCCAKAYWTPPAAVQAPRADLSDDLDSLVLWK